MKVLKTIILYTLFLVAMILCGTANNPWRNKHLTRSHCMLNIGSLIFGIGAWVFAGFAITTPKSFTSHKNTWVSFSLCVISLVFQMFELNRRVLLRDFAAIEDTIQAVLIASVALVSSNRQIGSTFQK